MRALLCCLILLAIGCDTRPEAPDPTRNFEDWLAITQIGSIWQRPPTDCFVTEQTEQYTKYRVFDPRNNTPVHLFVTVKSNKVVAIWEQ